MADQQEPGAPQGQSTPSREDTDESTFNDAAAELEADSGVVEASAEDLAGMLRAAQAKADEHYQQLMRAHAELENLKKRHARDLENAHKYALDKFVADLLGVWDSLELGLNAARDGNTNVDRLREGTELTLKMLTDVMTKFGVEPIDPIDQPFNPELHQAMSMQPRADVAPNTVVAVVQKGYALNGRLVRPAMVMVSQAAQS
jgi:molecular chaperone GrpE